MPKATRSTEGCIYFLYAPEVDRVKIGFTVNLKTRLNELELGSPTRLDLMRAIRGTLAVEIALLAIFSRHRLHGEWFKADAEMLAFIKRLQEADYYSPEMLLGV